ncbi:Speckle-type POZ protein-like [Halotydeus destructor]|nr:Speckle-type POZ protein-like [Halotydeus destructor]
MSTLQISSDFFKHEASVRWTVLPIQELGSHGTVRSPAFVVRFLRQFKWSMIISKSKCGSYHRTKVCLMSRVLDAPEITVKVSVMVLMGKGKRYQLGDFILNSRRSKSTVSGSKAIRFPLLNDLFAIEVHLSVINIGGNLNQSPNIVHYIKNRLELEALDSKTGDFDIEVDGKIIKVHRTTVEFKFEFFRAMMSSQCIEAMENRWIIKDVDYYTMEVIVRFIYTGMIAFYDVADTAKILKAAHKYCLDDLVIIAIEYLETKMLVNEMKQMLYLGDYLNLRELERACFRRIASEFRLDKRN